MKKKKRKNKTKNRFKNRTNRHHIKAKFRNGKDYNNIVRWDVNFHSRWHELFGTMTVIEIYEFIEIITKPNNTWNYQDLAILRERLSNVDY